MFRWAIVDCTGLVLRIANASLDVPRTRPREHWVIVPRNTKMRPGLTLGEINGS